MNTTQWDFVKRAVTDIGRGRATKLEMFTKEGTIKVYRICNLVGVGKDLCRIDIQNDQPETEPCQNTPPSFAIASESKLDSISPKL